MKPDRPPRKQPRESQEPPMFTVPPKQKAKRLSNDCPDCGAVGEHECAYKAWEESQRRQR